MNNTIIVTTLEINSDINGIILGVFVRMATKRANTAKKNPIIGTRLNSKDRKLTDHAKVDIPFVF